MSLSHIKTRHDYFFFVLFSYELLTNFRNTYINEYIRTQIHKYYATILGGVYMKFSIQYVDIHVYIYKSNLIYKYKSHIQNSIIHD